jgi:putative transcriptional regulator
LAIIITIDVMLAKRKMSVTELADRVGITIANISVLKNGKAKAIRLSTLEAICRALQCQPGDILEYQVVEAVGAANTAGMTANRAVPPQELTTAHRSHVPSCATDR